MKLYNLFIFLLIFFVLSLIGLRFHAKQARADSVTLDHTSSGTSTWQHTVTNTSSAVLLVGISGIPSSVTYNNIPLTKLNGVSSGNAHTSIWYLMNPPAGTYTVSVGTGNKGGAASFYNVTGVSQYGQPVQKSFTLCPSGANCVGNTYSTLITISGTNTTNSVFSTADFYSSNSTAVVSSGPQAIWSFITPNTLSMGVTDAQNTGSTSIKISGKNVNVQYDYVDLAATLSPLPITSTPTPTPTPSSYTITGNLFTDLNKNGLKDAGESNYTGTPSITASQGTVTVYPDGTYTITNLTAGTVTVSLTSPPQGYKMTYPLNGPPPSFQVTVGPGCNTNGASGAICN